jgi:hypothetical protein
MGGTALPARAQDRRRFPALGLAIGLGLAMLAVDTGLRLIEVTPLWRVLPLVEPILGQPDPDIGYDFTPGASGIWPKEHRAPVRINALGLRDAERSLAKPPGTYRVGLLGDSMVEAMQVDRDATFAAQAEARLRADGRKVELINLAMAGPNPIRQLLRLEKRGYPLGLDLVVANSAVGGFLSDLLLDDSESPAYRDAGNGEFALSHRFRQRLSQRYADTAAGRLFVVLYQHSPLLRMLYLRARQPLTVLLGLNQTATAAAVQPRHRPPPDRGVVCRNAAVALDPLVAFWRDHRPAARWTAAARFLDDFGRSARTHGVRLFYAMRDIPLAPAGCAEMAAARARLVEIMAEEFSGRGLRLVDWSARVAAATGDGDLARLHGFGLQRGSGHLNHEGHRVWAAALVALVRPELPQPAGRP